MRFIIAIIFVLINVIGCSQFKKTNGDITLDTSLLRNYSQTLEYQEKLRAPFISSYVYGDKNLVYVAALHTDGTPNTTHQTIEKAFADFKPDFLIVEGSAFTIISDPDDIKYAKTCFKRKYKNCGEDAFAINQALAAKIPFIYGEPSDAAIHSTLKKRLITDDELIAFYALREIPKWKWAGVKPDKELLALWNKKLVESLASASRKFRARTPMSETRFASVYRAKMGKEFNYMDINDETISPQTDRNPKWSNKIAYLVDALREDFLVKQIEKRVNKYKKVLIVYSSSHLIKQRAMLSDVFGPPADTSISK